MPPRTHALNHLPSPIRIVLIDEHLTHREAIAIALTGNLDAQIVGQANGNGEAVALAHNCNPDIVILITALPSLQVPDLVRRLKSAAPAAKVMVLSVHEEPEIVSHTLKAGASGYLTTKTSLTELLAAIRKIAAGGHVISQHLVDSMLFIPEGDGPSRADLTERELQVLCAFASGQSLKQIAGTVRLSAKTVSTHKTRLMQKLHLKTNADIVRYAIECDLV